MRSVPDINPPTILIFVSKTDTTKFESNRTFLTIRSTDFSNSSNSSNITNASNESTSVNEKLQNFHFNIFLFVKNITLKR